MPVGLQLEEYLVAQEVKMSMKQICKKQCGVKFYKNIDKYCKSFSTNHQNIYPLCYIEDNEKRTSLGNFKKIKEIYAHSKNIWIILFRKIYVCGETYEYETNGFCLYNHLWKCHYYLERTLDAKKKITSLKQT